ncbi:MAG: hypothetical protein R3C44_20895 [Chloroflexota bacterium]
MIFVRWNSNRYSLEPQTVSGEHAAGNTYPINAWRSGEVVADYHALTIPAFDCPAPEGAGCPLSVEVALGPRFADPQSLTWTPVADVQVIPPYGPVTAQPQRAQIDTFLLDGVSFPSQVRPQTPLVVRFSGWEAGFVPVLSLRAAGEPADTADPYVLPVPPPTEGLPRQWTAAVSTDVELGSYVLWAESSRRGAAFCGWLAPVTAGCALGTIEVSGAPLPEGATNFADQVALLDVDVPQTELQPGGQLPLEIIWQGLAPMTEDYTVFVQVLDAQDRIVGQVDAWPVQGTFPTSQWTPGQTVRDPYAIQLSDDLPAGEYKLNIGLYLLATLERLPVVDASGVAIDDKVEVGGLVVLPKSGLHRPAEICPTAWHNQRQR